MARTRRDETFILFNFDNLWTGFGNDEGYFVCLSERDRSVLLSSLRFAEWASRWVGDVDNPLLANYPADLLRTTGRVEDLSTALAYIEDLKAKLMTDCSSTIKEGFEALALAVRYHGDRIYNKPCCGSAVGTPGGGGTGGTGPTEQEGSLNDTTDQTPPPGFDTWAEYETYKCAVATFIIDRILTDLNTLASFTLLSLTAVGAIAGLLGATVLTPIIGDELLVVAGLVLFIAGQGLYYETVETLRDAISGSYADLVCSLFEANTAEDAKAAVKLALYDAIYASAADPLAYWANQIGATFFPYDSINLLFEKDTNRTYPEGDCGECGPLEGFDLDLTEGGTLVSGELIVPTGSTNSFVVTATTTGAGIAGGLQFTGYPGPPVNTFWLAVDELSGDITLSDGINAAGTYQNNWEVATAREIRAINMRVVGGGTYTYRCYVRADAAPDTA